MDPASAFRRAQRWFWTLTVVAVALVGALSEELTARPGPLIGATVAVTGLLLALVVAQVARLMAAIGRAEPPGRGPRVRRG